MSEKRDIVYTDAAGEIQGICKRSTLDVAFGTDENEIELNMTLTDAQKLGGTATIEQGAYVFVPGTEWGGVVDQKMLDTTTDPAEMTFTGRSWHGILEYSILRPDDGDDYLIVSGDCNTVLADLIERQGLEDVFEVTAGNCGTSVSRFQFDRYTDAYTGIRKMLASVGLTLKITKPLKGLCQLAAEESQEWNDQADDNYITFQLEHDYRPVNHLICLGSGELADRTVIDLYADADGNVSQRQTFYGVDEVCEIYDYSSVEDEDELLDEGTEKLEGYQGQGDIKLEVEDNAGYTVGDVITAKSVEVEVETSATIAKVMVLIDRDGSVDISYKVDDEEETEESIA